jgi:hypothetical protein
MKKKIYQILFLMIISGCISYGQIVSPSIGVSIHTGDIRGNSTAVSSTGASFFVDFFPWFENDVSFRASFTYSQMIEKFLPEERTGRYYPFIKTFSLKGFIRQDFSFPFYLEEGAGIITLNDRTFSDVNLWEIGAGFNLLCGYDFRKSGTIGFSAGLGIDYGVAFTKTTASYFLIYLQSQFYF